MSISRRINRPIYMDILLPAIYSIYIAVRPNGNSARLLMSLQKHKRLAFTTGIEPKIRTRRYRDGGEGG